MNAYKQIIIHSTHFFFLPQSIHSKSIFFTTEPCIHYMISLPLPNYYVLLVLALVRSIVSSNYYILQQQNGEKKLQFHS